MQQGRPSKEGVLIRLRDAVFPIYGCQEISKFLALGAIQFFIIFVLTLTRDLKDTLIITSCGAEAISFLKVCGVQLLFLLSLLSLWLAPSLGQYQF